MDLNGDNQYDAAVTVNSVSPGSANVTVKSSNSIVDASNESSTALGQENLNAPKTTSSTWKYWSWGIILLIIILIILFILIRRKKDRDSGYLGN